MVAGSYGHSISPWFWVVWPSQPNWQVNHGSQGSDSKIQHGLYLFQTCPQPILQFQFWEFGPSSPEKWLLSLSYWPNNHFLFQMAVWLVLLKKTVFQGVWVVTYTILLCLQIIQSSQFSPVCTLDRVMMDFSVSKDCTSKKWLNKRVDVLKLTQAKVDAEIQECMKSPKE